jgi:predicted NBD/HSP70 family sugar kinase
VSEGSVPPTTVIGIDVAGTKIRAGLVDPRCGRVAEEVSVPTPVSAGADDVDLWRLRQRIACAT